MEIDSKTYLIGKFILKINLDIINKALFNKLIYKINIENIVRLN